MPRVTATVSEEQDEWLEEKSGEGGEYASKSEVLRECIHRYEEVEDLQTKVDRLESEKKTLVRQRDEHKALVEFAREERNAIERREKRIQRKESEPVWIRARHWIFGRE